MPDDRVSTLNQYTVSVRLDKLIIEKKPPYGMHELALKVSVQFVCQCLSVFLDIEVLQVIG
jgi:hypothetical protein